MRPIRFRAWDIKRAQWLDELPPKEYMLEADEWDHHDCDEAYMRYPCAPFPRWCEGRVVIEQYTGLTDANGKEIYEGDIILISPASYESTLLNPNGVAIGDTPIYEVHSDKPLPAPDVPYARGAVEYGSAEFYCRYLWQCPSWEGSGAVSTSMDSLDRWYTVAVVGNIHDNPELLNQC